MAEKNKKLEHIQVKDNGIKVSQKVGDVLAKAKQLLERDCFKGLLQASDETSLIRYRIAQNNAFEKYRKTTQSIIKNAKNEVKQALKEDKTVNLSNKQVVQISSKINNGLVFLGTDAMKAYQSTLKDIVLKVKSAGDLKEQLGKHIASGLNIGVTYKDGKTYQFDTYWEMKARTDIQQEIGNNMISTGQENGIIFYITSFYGDCAPDHAEYQGKIYVDEKWESMAPKDRLDEIRDYINSNKLLTVQEVTQNPPFLTTRPNCRHYFQYIDIDSVLGAKTKDDVNQLRQERDLNSGGKYKPDKYKALQQQRQNERKIRAYKADLEKKQISLALEPGNKQLQSEIEIDKSNIRMFQKAQRDLAKQYSNIERRYDREKVGNRIDFGGNNSKEGNVLNFSVDLTNSQKGGNIINEEDISSEEWNKEYEKWAQYYKDNESTIREKIKNEEITAEDCSNMDYFDNNCALRDEYHNRIEDIPNQLPKDKSIEEQAKMACKLRNEIRQEIRNKMFDAKAKAFLDIIENKNTDFDALVEHKKKKYGYDYDEACKDVIRSASTSNDLFDKLFIKNSKGGK